MKFHARWWHWPVTVVSLWLLGLGMLLTFVGACLLMASSKFLMTFVPYTKQEDPCPQNRQS